jgi:hypothetical protein
MNAHPLKPAPSSFQITLNSFKSHNYIVVTHLSHFFITRFTSNRILRQQTVQDRQQWWRRHGNCGDGNGHGGGNYRLLGVANLFEVRKVNHQIKGVFRCRYNGVEVILFRQIMDGWVSKFGLKNLNFAGLKFRRIFAVRGNLFVPLLNSYIS